MNRSRITTLLLLIVAAAGCYRPPPPPKQATTPPPAKAESTRPAETELAQVDAAIEEAVSETDQSDSTEAPEPVEPVTPVGRIILFTPMGPLVLDLVATIDGEPLASARQKAVDEMVAKLMTEADGKLTWENALDDPRFSLGEAPRTRQDRRILIASVDANRDRLVQPGEAAEYLARLANVGPALAFGVSDQTWSDRAASQLWRLADLDRDGSISAEEVAALESELLKLDADGNELIEAAELAENDLQRRRAPAMPYERTTTASSKLAILCDATYRGDSLAYTIDELYRQKSDGSSQRFSTVSKLIDALDANFNGRIDRREPLDVPVIAPHGRIEVAFGTATTPESAVAIQWLDPELEAVIRQKAGPFTVDYDLSGDRLLVASRESPGGAAGMQNPLFAQFASLDRDSNGYLEKDELPQGNMNLDRALRAADADNDGKLYRVELEAFLAWQNTLRSAAVRLDVSAASDPLFGLLDTSGDGRLTLREMRGALQSCQSRDTNGDSRLELAELPVVIRLDFSHVGYAVPNQTEDASKSVDEAPAADAGPPVWFMRMDLNGDGDLVPREFLGTREQFAELDSDGDGFLDAAEARAAK